MIKISVEIDAWDCFVYSGRLYVLSFDNELLCYDWHRLVLSLSNPRNHAALNCIFLRADYAESKLWEPALNHDQFIDLLLESLRSVNGKDFYVSKELLSRFRISRHLSPIANLSSAFTIYKNLSYLSSDDGVFSVPLDRVHGKSLGTISKITDCRAVELVGGGISSLAMAAGSEGAYRYRVNAAEFNDVQHARELSSRHTTRIDWSRVSLFRSSPRSHSSLIAFDRIPKKEQKDRVPEVDLGKFDFREGGADFSWVIGNTIYAFRGSSLELYAWKLKGSSRPNDASLIKHPEFSRIKTIPFSQSKGRVVSGGGARFGSVIELENSLVVCFTSGETWTVPFEVARWRAYNRAKWYWNQLHLVTEDSVVIVGFPETLFENYKKRIIPLPFSAPSEVNG